MDTTVDNGRYISLLSRLILKHTTEQINKIGLSVIEYSYLMILKEKQELSQDELTKHAMVDKAQTTRAVSSLFKKGLVHKSKDLKDNRVYKISLTSKGKDLVPKVKDEIYKFETILNDGLSMDDQRLMKKMLIKMIRNMKGSSDLL